MGLLWADTLADDVSRGTNPIINGAAARGRGVRATAAMAGTTTAPAGGATIAR